MNYAKRKVRISSSAHLKPVPVAGFIKYNKKVAITLPRMYNYRKPRIVKSTLKGKPNWYVEYWYLIPVRVKEFYGGKEWLRFRVREDINRRHGQEREIYAEWLRTEIEDSLERGYNPFEPEGEIIQKEEQLYEAKKELGAQDAILLFLETWKKRGLAKASMAKYERTANRLIDWLIMKKIPYRDIKGITTENIEQFLNDMKKEKNLSNREFNNHYDFTRTIFNFLLKKKYITESPMVDIDKLKARTNKHRFYDEAALEMITKGLAAVDPYCLFAFETVYYLCVRSEKELKGLKVGNIFWEQNKILAEAEGTKGNSARYIPMDENIKKLFLERGIDKFPSDYYVFGIEGKPSEKPFGPEFFSKRFRKVREKLKMPDWFTIYSAKHTRVIHLKMDGLADQDIMALTGHKDFVAYAKYLRDLGLSADPDKINKISRKI